MLMLAFKSISLTSLFNTTILHALSYMLNIVRINQSDRLFSILEESCGRSPYVALTLKSANLTNISNIHQNFHMSKSDIEENQNLVLIYCRSQISKPRNQNSELKTQI